MHDILVQVFHIFIVVIVIGFGIGALYAMAGRTDHWNERFKKGSRERNIKKGSV